MAFRNPPACFLVHKHTRGMETRQRSRETSLSGRGRHERAGALIIDRMIKADEEGFLPPVKDLIAGLLLPGAQGARRRRLRINTLNLG